MLRRERGFREEGRRGEDLGGLFLFVPEGNRRCPRWRNRSSHGPQWEASHGCGGWGRKGGWEGVLNEHMFRGRGRRVRDLMMKGGFSTMSCPTLRMRSAEEMATWGKSPEERAQHPKYRGCVSGGYQGEEWGVSGHKFKEEGEGRWCRDLMEASEGKV